MIFLYRNRRVKCDETKPSCSKCTRSWRKCRYGQLSEDPPPSPPADVFCDDDGDEEQPEAAARRDNFSLEDTVNPLALGASAGSQISEPAQSRAMSDGGPPERPSSQKPPPPRFRLPEFGICQHIGSRKGFHCGAHKPTGKGDGQWGRR